MASNAKPRRSIIVLLEDYIKTGDDEFFEMLETYNNIEEMKLRVAQHAVHHVIYNSQSYNTYFGARVTLEDGVEERYIELCKRLVALFGTGFFTEPAEKATVVSARGKSIEEFMAETKLGSAFERIYLENRDYILEETGRYTKSANFSRAALIRQALIEAKGDPHAAANIVMAGPKRDKKEKKSKKEKLGGVGKKDDSFEMPVSKYGNITEPVWYINKKPKVAKQATKTNSTIIVPGATKPMPVYSVVNIAMVDGNGHGRTWGFFYDDANERVIISFARPQYDTDANVAGLVKFIESRLGMVSTTTDLYYKYFRDRGIVIPLATAAPSRSSLSSVYGWDADHLRNMTEDPFDEGNFEDLDGVYSRSDEEE